jgi:acetolactate synthase-1/2/3 large subunit
VTALSKPDPRPSAERTIAAYAVDLAVALGADCVFTLTGGMAMHLNRAVSTHPVLKAIYGQHEQACVAAAEGYAKAADFRKPGFAVVTAGPGVSNTVTALLSAHGDSVPMIVLAGQIKREDINPFGVRTHGAQEIPSREVISPCVKRFVRLDPDGFRQTLVEAYAEALSGRPGPVFVEIPLDVQGMPIEAGPEEIAADVHAIRRRLATGLDAAATTNLRQQLEALMQAERPLLYVGNGCRIAGVEDAVRALVESLGLPAVFSWLSFDILPASHPNHFGCPGGLAPIHANRILGRADHILFLGARLDLGTTAFQRRQFGEQARRVFVDIDPAELSKFAGFENGQTVQADLRALAGVGPLTATPADPGWLAWCAAEKSGGLAEERARLATSTLNTYAIAARLSDWCADRVVVPASSGYAEETLTRFFAPPTGSRFFNGAALGAMGFGLPIAIGAAFGSDRKVVCVDADGGIMLNLQELATLSSYGPAGFVLFVLNNDGYESIRASQSRHFGGVYGADEPSGVFIPRFADLAAAFGLRHVHIDTPDALDAFLDAHDDTAPPVLAELIIPRAEPRGPAVKTIMRADGMPFSTPLQDIDW